MSKKIKRIYSFIKFFKATAIAVMGISFLLLIIFSGEAVSLEAEKLQFKLLFLFLGIGIISYIIISLIEKFQYSNKMFDIEKADFEKRAMKIAESAQTERDIQECLVSIGKASPESLQEIDSSLESKILELKEEYISLS